MTRSGSGSPESLHLTRCRLRWRLEKRRPARVLGPRILQLRREKLETDERRKIEIRQMSCHDTFRIAYGREVDACIPAQEEIKITGDLLDLLR